MNEDTTQEYYIAGQTVTMTHDQAVRWNRDETTDGDLGRILVNVPGRYGATSCVRDGEVVVNAGLPVDHDITMREALTDAEYRDMFEGEEAYLQETYGIDPPPGLEPPTVEGK